MKFSVIKQRGWWWGLSTAIILSGLIAMAISWQQLGTPLRPSLDFIGGTRLQYELDCSKQGNCDQPINIGLVRQVMEAQGLTNSRYPSGRQRATRHINSDKEFKR